MNDYVPRRLPQRLAAIAIASSAALMTWAPSAMAADVKVNLTGDQEVPAVKTIGVGTGFFAIANNKSITGGVNTVGIAGTAAHIHEGAPGSAGPVAIPLVKQGDSYKIADGTKLTDAQLAAFQAGKLYVNVHTAANPNGELRGQLKP